MLDHKNLIKFYGKRISHLIIEFYNRMQSLANTIISLEARVKAIEDELDGAPD